MKVKSDHEIEALLDRLDPPGPKPGFFEALTEEIETEPLESARVVPHASRRSRRVRWTAPAAGALAAAAVIVLLIGNSLSRPTPGQSQAEEGSATSLASPLLASNIVSSAITAYTTTDNIQAKVDYSLAPSALSGRSTTESHNYDATILGNGDFSLIDTSGATTVYSAQTGVLLVCPAGAHVTCDENQGLSARDPQAIAADRLGLNRALALLRNADTTTSAKPKNVTFDGLQAWQLQLSYSDDPVVSPQYAAKDVHTTLTVDKSTNYPLQVVTTVAGHPYLSVTLHDVRINSGLGPNLFSTDPPNGSNARIYPGTYERTTLADIQSEPSLLTPRVSKVPDGFQLAEVSADRSGGVTELTYRHGLEEFTVTALKPPPVTDWLFDTEFPKTPGEGTLNETTAKLSTGHFAGRETRIRETTSDLKAYVFDQTELVTVEGDLDPSQAEEILGNVD